MFYRPKRLSKARQEVQKAHPYSVTDFEDVTKFKTSQIGERLREKIRRAHSKKLPDLVASLDKYERKFLSVLACDEETIIRQRTIECFYIAPQLAQAQHLWKSGAQYFNSKSSHLAYRLLKAASSLQEQLTADQLKVVAAFSENQQAALKTTWTIAEDAELSAPDMREHLRIPENSKLASVLNAYLLSHGSRRAWALQSPIDIHTIYRRADEQTQIAALINASHLYATWFKRPDARALMLIKHLVSQPHIEKNLEQNEPDTWAWCCQIYNYIELKKFFDGVNDNERLEFWAEYIPYVNELTQDTINSRLFLNFGDFGVIEFGEVGNAAYLYPRHYFEDYLQKQKDVLYQSSDNRPLKDRSRGDALIHHFGWQRRFREELRRRLPQARESFRARLESIFL